MKSNAREVTVPTVRENTLARHLARLKHVEIVGITPYMMSNAEIEALGAGRQIDSPETTIAEGAINRRDLGNTDSVSVCSTCHRVGPDCQGHPGFAKLGVPVPGPLGTKDDIVNILNSICWSCCQLRLPAQFVDTHLLGSQRRESIARMTERMKPECRNIVNPPPNFDPDKRAECARAAKTKYIRPPNVIEDPCILRWQVLDKQPYNYQHDTMFTVRARFEAISAADADLLGFPPSSSPASLIVENILVPPVSYRVPAVRGDNISQHHITAVLRMLLRRVEILNGALLKLDEQDLAEKETTICKTNTREKIRQVQYFLSALHENRSGRVVIVNRDPAKTFGIIGGKRGYYRQFGIGCRVDRCGRTVIDPGIIPFGTALIPGSFQKITIPVMVSLINIESLNEAARQNRVIHYTPARGKDAGRRLRYSARPPEDGLQIGDRVDYIPCIYLAVVNRQPTLHRSSMQGVWALPMQGRNNMSIHMSGTGALNADFDGDEMNIHMPATGPAQADVLYVSSTSNHIIDPETGGVAMGLPFNGPTALMLLTAAASGNNSPIFPERTAAEVEDIWATFVHTFIPAAFQVNFARRLAHENVAPRSMRAFFSLAFPETLTWHAKRDINHLRAGDRLEKDREDVVIRNGVYLRGRMGKPEILSLIKHAEKRYGSRVAGDMIGSLQFIVDFFLYLRGFSAGLDDFRPKDAERKKARSRVEETMREVQLQIDSIEVRRRPETDSRWLSQVYDEETTAAMQRVTQIGNALVEVEVARGENCVAQMIGSGAKGTETNFAQVTAIVGNMLVSNAQPKKAMEGGRLSAYAEVNSSSILTSGMVKSAFFDGLTPFEMLTHSAPSRESIVKTNITTADTGTLSQRLQFLLSSIHIGWNGAIVRADGAYVADSFLGGFAPNAVYPTESNGARCYLPFNLQAIINEINDPMVLWMRARLTAADPGQPPAPPRPLTGEEIAGVLKAVPHTCAASPASAEADRSAFLRVFAKMLAKEKVRPAALGALKDLVFNLCMNSLIEPGTPIGSIAAEAGSAPVTQMVLNSFHNVGQTSRSAVFLFAEIYQQAATRKTPIIKVHIRAVKGAATAIHAAAVASAAEQAEVFVKMVNSAKEVESTGNFAADMIKAAAARKAGGAPQKAAVDPAAEEKLFQDMLKKAIDDNKEPEEPASKPPAAKVPPPPRVSDGSPEGVLKFLRLQAQASGAASIATFIGLTNAFTVRDLSLLTVPAPNAFSFRYALSKDDKRIYRYFCATMTIVGARFNYHKYKNANAPFLRIHLSPGRLLRAQITVAEVAAEIRGRGGVEVVYSPTTLIDGDGRPASPWIDVYCVHDKDHANKVMYAIAVAEAARKARGDRLQKAIENELRKKHKDYKKNTLQNKGAGDEGDIAFDNVDSQNQEKAMHEALKKTAGALVVEDIKGTKPSNRKKRPPTTLPDAIPELDPPNIKSISAIFFFQRIINRPDMYKFYSPASARALAAIAAPRPVPPAAEMLGLFPSVCTTKHPLSKYFRDEELLGWEPNVGAKFRMWLSTVEILNDGIPIGALERYLRELVPSYQVSSATVETPFPAKTKIAFPPELRLGAWYNKVVKVLKGEGDKTAAAAAKEISDLFREEFKAEITCTTSTKRAREGEGEGHRIIFELKTKKPFFSQGARIAFYTQPATTPRDGIIAAVETCDPVNIPECLNNPVKFRVNDWEKCVPLSHVVITGVADGIVSPGAAASKAVSDATTAWENTRAAWLKNTLTRSFPLPAAPRAVAIGVYHAIECANPIAPHVLRDICVHPAVAHERTRSNVFAETSGFRGIEALSLSVIREIMTMFANQKVNIIPHHVVLIVHTMLSYARHGARASLMPISMSGLLQQQTGFLSSMALASPLRSISASASAGQPESMTPVLSSIVLGQPIQIGSGIATLMPAPGHDDKELLWPDVLPEPPDAVPGGFEEGVMPALDVMKDLFNGRPALKDPNSAPENSAPIPPKEDDDMKIDDYDPKIFEDVAREILKQPPAASPPEGAV